MMYSFDFIILRKALFTIVFKKTFDVIKVWHKQERMLLYYDLLKSAAKIRAKIYDKCLKYEKWSHTSKCSNKPNLLLVVVYTIY